jgi:hypothetical protein
MRKKGRIVAGEFISNCVLAATLAGSFEFLFRPAFESTAAHAGIVLVSCLASGAAHGMAAFLLGWILFNKDIALEVTFTDMAIPRRVLVFLFAALFTTLRSALLWAIVTAPATVISYGVVVNAVARFLAPDRPWWLAAVGAGAGLLTGLLAPRLIRRVAPDQTMLWILISQRLLHHSNFYLLARARSSPSRSMAATP